MSEKLKCPKCRISLIETNEHSNLFFCENDNCDFNWGYLDKKAWEFINNNPAEKELAELREKVNSFGEYLKDNLEMKISGNQEESPSKVLNYFKIIFREE